MLLLFTSGSWWCQEERAASFLERRITDTFYIPHYVDIILSVKLRYWSRQNIFCIHNFYKKYQNYQLNKLQKFLSTALEMHNN